jgi:hypothetical protein
MSRLIEDRLAAALDARAELVTPQDLRPLEVPTPRRRPPVGVLLLAAAASAAVIATPFLLEDGSRTTPSPGPAGSPSAGVSEPAEPEPSEASETPAVPADAIVVDRQRADVDGDGRPDKVRLLSHSTYPEDPAEGSVEVTLASGGTGVAAVPFGYPGLKPAFDINGDGREQVLLSHTEGGDAAQLLVYTWHEGGLVLTQQEGKAPLGFEEGGTYVAGYYTDDRGLISWESRDAGGATFEVDEWSWAVDGERLVPTPAGTRCKDIGQEPPRPCGDGS